MNRLDIRKLYSLVFALTFLGCGGGASADDAEQNGHLICDGSDEPRLLFQFGYGPEHYPGIDLIHENGYGFLVVDGQCRAWLKRRPIDPVRAGVLDSSAADELARTMRVGEWGSLAGSYCTVQVDGAGRKELHARLGDQELIVDRSCDESDPERGKVAHWALAATSLAIAQLWNGLSEIDGPVRFMVIRENDPTLTGNFDTTLEWPLPTPASELSVELLDALELREHTPRLIAEGEDARKLRELRRQWLKGDYSVLGGFVPVEEEGRYYMVFLRDTIPLEDENGLSTVK